MLSWESKELDTIKNIRHQLMSIWSCTELDLDDADKDDVLHELGKVSSILDNLLTLADDELDRLIIRDAKLPKGVCSHCESHRITICEPCLRKMEE